jgi:hypothetical protein
LRLEPERYAVKVRDIVALRQCDGRLAMVVDENRVDRLGFRVTTGLLPRFPICVGLSLAGPGNHDHVHLAGLKLDAQHTILAELPLR